MGNSYMEAVVTCLSGELQRECENPKPGEFALIFRKKVVQKITLRAGVVEADDD